MATTAAQVEQALKNVRRQLDTLRAMKSTDEENYQLFRGIRDLYIALMAVSDFYNQRISEMQHAIIELQGLRSPEAE